MDRGNRCVHFRRLVGAGVIVAFLATAFVPAVAAQAPSTDSNAFSSKSIEKAVAGTKVGPEAASRASDAAASPATNDAARAGKGDAPKTQTQATKSGSFFKTRTGVLVLAIMAAGTGYALYSAKEDRIKGSIR